jgi:putative DNA methylase
LAACRAVVFASLIPDPDDPECPESFRSLVGEVLNHNEFKPKNGEGSATDDTPRNRCLEYIKHLVRWENSNKPHYIEPARKLVAAAHRILHPDAEGDIPKVLDPFAGGGAIPLEALRLGCEAHAVDLNPVAHLIELCTLVYPQRFGQPNSRPVPKYIKRLIAHNKAIRQAKGQESANLFEEEDTSGVDSIFPTVEITEAEYLRNPLAADVKYWGHWLLAKARLQIGQFYPPDPDGSVPVGYLWARTVKSPSPQHPYHTPLYRHGWLCKKGKRQVAFRLEVDSESGVCTFLVGQDGDVSHDPSQGTVRQGKAVCSFSEMAITNAYLKQEGKANRLGQQLAAVVLASPGGGRVYRSPTASDQEIVEKATNVLRDVAAKETFGSLPAIPDEKIPPTEIRRLSTPIYGLDTFGKLFLPRQLLTLIKLVSLIHEVDGQLKVMVDDEYSSVISTFLALIVDRIADRSSTESIWHTTRETIEGAVGRHTLPMNWDFAESNPIDGGSGNIAGAVEWVTKMIEATAKSSSVAAIVKRGTAQQLPEQEASLDAIITDPPYYDSVPYSHLADFFYVWLKRILGHRFPTLFSTPLCPKGAEIVQDRPHRLSNSTKTKDFFEHEMTKAFQSANSKLAAGGLFVIVYAHKTTAAWETLVSALLSAGFEVVASWPLHTEMTGGMVKIGKAVLASSIFLVCRKRSTFAGAGLWDDVRKELKPVAKERLEFFWSQGIRGADFFISAIGPALSVFGKYEKVTKLSGDEVTVGQFLDEVRSLVTAYALNKIMKTTHTATIDAESQFYVIWKWSYGEAKVPADEAFKLAQALGMDTESMWDKTGVLEKAGENVLAVPVAKRMKIKGLGEPNADSTPASIIDVLHRLCVFRDKNDAEGMTEFLARSGQGRNSSLWLVAQAISEILPDGDKEKQLMQGILNQRGEVEKAAQQGMLF